MSGRIVFNLKQNDSNMIYFDISDGHACMVRCLFEFTRVGHTDNYTIKKNSKLKIKYKNTYEPRRVAGEIIIPKDEWFGEFFVAGVNNDGTPNKSIRFSNKLNQDVYNRLESNSSFIFRYIAKKIRDDLGSLLEYDDYSLLRDFLDSIDPTVNTNNNIYINFSNSYIKEISDRPLDKNLRELADAILNKLYDESYVLTNHLVLVPKLLKDKEQLKIKLSPFRVNNGELSLSRSHISTPNVIKSILENNGWRYDGTYYYHNFYGQDSLFDV